MGRTLWACLLYEGGFVGTTFSFCTVLTVPSQCSTSVVDDSHNDMHLGTQTDDFLPGSAYRMAITHLASRMAHPSTPLDTNCQAFRAWAPPRAA
eukprot:1001753-Amphidinium_carterae.1